MILAEIGVDVSRFPTEKHFASWLGVCQRQHETGFVMAGRQAQGTWTTALFADGGTLLSSLDTKSRVTRAVFSADGKTLYLAATVGQPPRRDGKWGDYGRIHVVGVAS